MTIDEKLDLILGEIQDMKSKMQSLETRMGELETRMGDLETRMGNLETRMGDLETRIGDLETRMGDLEQSHLAEKAAIDNTINKAVDVMYEVFKTNAEMMSKMDYGIVKHNTEIAVALAKLSSDKIDRFLEKQPA